MLDRVADRFGRRATWLITLGGVWIAHGLGHLLEPAAVHPWVLHTQVPAWVLALAWTATGAISVAVGLQGRHPLDWLGHAALYVMPAVKVVSFTFAWLLWLGDIILDLDAALGWAGGWYPALIWLIVSVALRLVASWPNPDQPLVPPPSDAQDRA